MFEYAFKIAANEEGFVQVGNSIPSACNPAQFIHKISLFILLLNVIRQAGTTADACTSRMIQHSAPLAQRRMLYEYPINRLPVQ